MRYDSVSCEIDLCPQFQFKGLTDTGEDVRGLPTWTFVFGPVSVLLDNVIIPLVGGV